ncbi:MAG TPA: glycosyltransferase family 4 protein [Spirochaetota bacterium]|nr:glycosyltransferase family 4 protein [Spirochaetota bacterium]HOS31760.1 glycosyltransferase family 4 protein [Spirochaetota bacterium]HOS54534.1 glycosyltransferase family 4 protein [Spirochaetota bacterium]HPK60824.1 glycosyltransferase family 4 protein [Spirochaetota bacterium]HQF77176.1 glycosyltransferase family 4 protein [Spirochaetota bacterium]
MKKIAIITNMMSFYRLDLFNELAKNRDYKFHFIFSSETEKNNRIWEINKDKIDFEYTILNSKSVIKKSRGIIETRVINIPKAVFKTLKKIDPDVIIASEYNLTSVKSFFYAKLRRKKFISWSDGTLNSERFISKPQLFIRKFICKKADYFIASSTETREAQMKYGANKNNIALSFLAIDVEAFITALQKLTKNSNDAPRILFCGYLLKLKGVANLLSALKDIQTDFILDIIGSGEEEKNLRDLAKKYSLEDKVIFHGYKNREEIVKFYKNADIFIFPSLNDAFGLALVEALAARLPIIASKYAGGARDTVLENENGYIIDPENTDKFREKIEILLRDEKLRKIMGEKSFRLSEKFFLKNVSRGFFEAIEKC